MLTLKKHKLHKFNMISRKSDLTGNINSMELPLSNFQIDMRQCKTDDDLRNEFQFLNFSERQFLLTGITLKEQLLNNPIFYKKITKDDKTKYDFKITKAQYEKLNKQQENK